MLKCPLGGQKLTGFVPFFFFFNLAVQNACVCTSLPEGITCLFLQLHGVDYFGNLQDARTSKHVKSKSQF